MFALSSSRPTVSVTYSVVPTKTTALPPHDDGRRAGGPAPGGEGLRRGVMNPYSQEVTKGGSSMGNMDKQLVAHGATTIDVLVDKVWHAMVTPV